MKTSTTSGKATALVVVLILIILVLIYMVVAPYKKAEAPVNATSTPEVVTVDKIPAKSGTTSYEIDVETPVVKGMTNTAVQKKINDNLALTASNITSEFKDQANQARPIGGPDTTSTLSIKLLSSNVVKNAVLAINQQVSTYFTGAAHPITISAASNFDLSTGKELELIDIFDNSSVTYLQVISDYTTKELKKHLAEVQGVSADSKDLQFFPEGSDSNPENFSSFLITDDGIMFLFGQYQVAPYVMGEQSVVVPWSVIKQYMQKNALTETLTK